jgi:hypothetical protein
MKGQEIGVRCGEAGAEMNAAGITRKAWQKGSEPTGKIRGPTGPKESVPGGGALDDSWGWGWDSGAGAHGSRPLCAPPPRAPLARLPAPASPSPSQLCACRSTVPNATRASQVGDDKPGPPPSSSPDENRRRPSLLLSILSCFWSRACRRCHLKTPQACGREGEGKKKARKVRAALAQEPR